MVFELAATDDGRAAELFAAMDVDPSRAYPAVLRLRDVAEAVRSVNLDDAKGPKGGGAKDVA